MSARLVVLTGAPGSGKTAILDRVAAEIRCVGEPAREILAEQRSSGGQGTPDRDPAHFVDLLLKRSIDKHAEAQALAEAGQRPILFDRGVPDCIAYAMLMGLDPAPGVEAARAHRYHSRVLVCEPWEEIYTLDDERTMSFDATVPFQEALVKAYRRAGYTLVDVPRDTVERRVAFVRTFVADTDVAGD